ncbi:MAG: PaaI family thioesterase [Tistlia sp.]|uniref:PaaI family thioesterase n=1 Tax=Tistlia sp. TaxID=3057121 RepID=UPI0034A2173C
MSGFPEEEPVGIQRTLGFSVEAWEDGRAVLVLEVDERHLNRSGVLHGGVAVTLLDQAMSLSGLWTPEDDPGGRRKSVTLSLTTSFTGQCDGGVIRAVGTRRAAGRRIYSCSGELTGPDGTVLAIAQATFQLRRGSERPQPPSDG